MSSGPHIPGNRIYPGTAQHWSHRQRISFREFVKGAVWITVVILGIVVALTLLGVLWR